MLANTELLDKSHGAAKWRDLFEFDIASTGVPTNILQLGDHKIRDDYRIAKHYLELQTQNSKSYQLRRCHFLFSSRDAQRQTANLHFLGKSTHIQMKRNYHQNKTKRPHYSSTDFLMQHSETTSPTSCKRLNASSPLITLHTPRNIPQTFKIYITTPIIALGCATIFKVIIRRLAF